MLDIVRELEALKKRVADLEAVEEYSRLLMIGDDESVTIAAGAITVARTGVSIDTQNGDATDDLNTISGGVDGQLAILKAEDSTHTVVVKDAADNIYTEGDFSMDHGQDRILLICDGTNWLEIARSNNA
jgi:hypothetical protein